jgi:hypothetical protein
MFAWLLERKRVSLERGQLVALHMGANMGVSQSKRPISVQLIQGASVKLK